jgi:hypothetical protein
MGHRCYITNFDPQKNSPENLRANGCKIIYKDLKWFPRNRLFTFKPVIYGIPMPEVKTRPPPSLALKPPWVPPKIIFDF